MKRTILAKAVVTSLALTCTACSSQDKQSTNAAPSITSVAESPAPSAQTAVVTQTTTDLPPDNAHVPTGKNQPCSTKVPVERINNEIMPTLTPSVNGAWAYRSDLSKSRYDSCADLSYVELVQKAIGDGAYDTVLLLFHKGEYLGIDSIYSQHISSISSGGSSSFTVNYTDFEAISRANASFAEGLNKYVSPVHFSWDGSKVQSNGRFPNTDRPPRSEK